MNNSRATKFDRFFSEKRYIALKNSLYNYIIRKSAVQYSLRDEVPGMILETGSGISPVTQNNKSIVYTDISLEAMKILKGSQEAGSYVVADITKLPFKENIFSHAISSEVLEHIEDDRKALEELSRVLRQQGSLIITVPHRKIYYSFDDRFVGHFRRYELEDIIEKLRITGFEPVYHRKVLGPIDKVLCCCMVFVYSMLRIEKHDSFQSNHYAILGKASFPLFKWINKIIQGIVWAEVKIIPFRFSSVILIKALKKKSLGQF